MEPPKIALHVVNFEWNPESIALHDVKIKSYSEILTVLEVEFEIVQGELYQWIKTNFTGIGKITPIRSLMLAKIRYVLTALQDSQNGKAIV